MLIENQKAYIAGFIDGEGCINIYRTFPKYSKADGVSVSNYRTYAMNVSITNTHLPTMEWLTAIIEGARLNTKKMNITKPHWRQTYTIKIGSIASLKILKQILPYLITKKKQAELAIKFQEVAMIKFTEGRKFYRLTKEEIDFRDDCWNKMSMLNTNGHKKYSGFLHKTALAAETKRDDTVR
jgi:hypothetical protein